MKLELIAFTAQGAALAARLAQALSQRGHQAACTRDERLSAAEWASRAFARSQGLIFVGAAGIAVRSIAPLLRHKSRDPAVLVVDEGDSLPFPSSPATWAGPTTSPGRSPVCWTALR